MPSSNARERAFDQWQRATGVELQSLPPEVVAVTVAVLLLVAQVDDLDTSLANGLANIEVRD